MIKRMESRVYAEKILEVLMEKLRAIESRLDNLTNGFKAMKGCLKKLKELPCRPTPLYINDKK